MAGKNQEVGFSFWGKAMFFYVALLVRLGLVYVAKRIDESPLPKKYTDTDYDVFTDAAFHVYHGGSPYERHTYRYTPLAAYLCVPNHIIHFVFGKVVFCVLDIVMGYFMWNLVESQNRSKQNTWAYVAFWLYNPITITMSTRGSNDNIITMLVFATLHFLLKKQYVLAGLLYGFSVHFKIYPIVFSFVFFLFIDHEPAKVYPPPKKEGDKPIDYKNLFKPNQPFTLPKREKVPIFKGSLLGVDPSSKKASFFTPNRITFTVISASTFLAFTLLFYFIYGYEFLYEGYLYHFVRKDNRHNYSVYFSLIY